MRYFYDTEFYEDGEIIELISIGIVAEDGRTYYAVNSEINLERIKEKHDWLVRNVLPSLPLVHRKDLDEYLQHPRSLCPAPSIKFVALDRKDTVVKPHWVIANEVREFLLAEQTEGEPLVHTELWAWFGAYDHVTLMQLWGPMVKRPKGLPMYTHDLKQEADRLGIPKDEYPVQEAGHHNALADAMWNRDMFEFLAGWRHGAA